MSARKRASPILATQLRVPLMVDQLPSLLRFQPKFYSGGPGRFYLPLLYDLVASQKPKSIVASGFGDGEAFFTLCQAAREQNLECRCAALRREDFSSNNCSRARKTCRN